MQRHKSGKGTIIEYRAADGTLKYLLVLDAKYRSVLAFGTHGTDVPELTTLAAANVAGNFVIHGKASIPNDEPMPDTVTNDAIYNQWHATLAADKTAKANCDIWMTYNSQTDSQGIKGVPAVAWCRNQIVDDKPCDLPNMYEAMVIFACGDQLDEMDPTTSGYPDLRLGYTSTTANPGSGRCQKFGGMKSNSLFSSTECTYQHVRQVDNGGSCTIINKKAHCTIVPVLEL